MPEPKTDPPTSLTIAQLYLMKSLLRHGWEANPPMVSVLLSRCGASRAEFDALVDAGLVEDKGGSCG